MNGLTIGPKTDILDRLVEEGLENNFIRITSGSLVDIDKGWDMLNYFKNTPVFPHQSTADQYFDEVQFEAYRMLGEHIGRQAVKRFLVSGF